MADIPRVKVARDSFMESQRKKWGYKIGQVYDLWSTPCESANPMLFILAFFSAIPEAIFTVSGHDCSDNQWDKGKQLWRPFPPRGGRKHGRGGTPTFKKDGALPGGPPAGSGWTQGAWKLGDLIQKIGAKLLIIDAALDLAVNWLTTALTWDGCPPPPDCYGAGQPLLSVYGDNGAVHRVGIAAFPGNVGVFMGIGGWITTAPVQQIYFNSNVPTEQFGGTKYIAPAAVFSVMTRAGGGAFNFTRTNTSAPISSTSTAHSSNAENFGFPTTGLEGWPEVWEVDGTGSGGGVGSTSAIATVMGERKTPFLAAGNKDPCSGAPLTGTVPRGR